VKVQQTELRVVNIMHCVTSAT